MGHGGGRVKRKISKQFYLPRPWKGRGGEKKRGTLLSTGYPDNSPRKESRPSFDGHRPCLRSDEPLLRETLRKQTDSTKTDSTNNTNVLAYISVITRRRVWKYPTRYLSLFRSFLSSPHSVLLSLFASLIQNNNSRFPRDSDYSPDGCNRKRG